MKIYEISKGATLKYPPRGKIRAAKLEKYPEGYTVFSTVCTHKGLDLRQQYSRTGISMTLKETVVRYRQSQTRCHLVPWPCSLLKKCTVFLTFYPRKIRP